MDYSFQRYLAAKRTVDDRALNRSVWSQMADHILEWQRTRSINILEVGAGTGTMFERMVEWGALCQGNYTAIDAAAENIAQARLSIPDWARSAGFGVNEAAGSDYKLERMKNEISLKLETIDLFDLIERDSEKNFYDMLVAHAFLDLFDIPSLLPRLISLVKPGGLLYLTINFDGETIFEPVRDRIFEDKIIGLYHRSMDERISAGQISGDSRSGRHLFKVLSQNGLDILSAGSSDWVVYPRNQVYPADEAYFLHYILDFFEEALGKRSEMDPLMLRNWLADRHAQIDCGELVYLAHQMDFLACRNF